MKIIFGKKILDISVKQVGFFGKFSGLMFRTRETRNLLFDFGKNSSVTLHSWFVFFDFLVLWLDDKNRILDFELVHPFRASVKTNKKFSKIVEIPSNSKNKEIINFFVGKRKV